MATLGERLDAIGVFPTVDYPREEVTPSLTAGDIANGSVGPVVEVYPCYGGYHDFAVGKEHAVCNKCQYVLTFGANNEPTHRTNNSNKL